MAKLFQDILNEAAEKGIIPLRSVGATKWLRDAATKTSEEKADPSLLIRKDRAFLKKTSTIGKMYLFNYLPKHHSTLPYYDLFPLVFPFQKTENGFLGINLHYLPLNLRAKMMDGLYSVTSAQSLDEDGKIRLNYKILTKLTQLRFYKPCLKRYLNSQLKSRFLEIPATQWDIALFLPLQRFVKATEQQVYRDSRKILKGY